MEKITPRRSEGMAPVGLGGVLVKGTAEIVVAIQLVFQSVHLTWVVAVKFAVHPAFDIQPIKRITYAVVFCVEYGSYRGAQEGACGPLWVTFVLCLFVSVLGLLIFVLGFSTSARKI